MPSIKAGGQRCRPRPRRVSQTAASARAEVGRQRFGCLGSRNILLCPFLLTRQPKTMNRVWQERLLCHCNAPATLLKTTFGNYGSSSCQTLAIHQKLVKASLNRMSLYRFSAFSIDKDLSRKKCVPCNSKDIRPMVDQSANELMPQVPGWNLVNEHGALKLQRSWKAKTFMKGLEFFQAVAEIAEAEGHHPDLHLVDWNSVKIEIWTHSVGGLTENDFILAAKINSLDLEHILRRKN